MTMLIRERIDEQTLGEPVDLEKIAAASADLDRVKAAKITELDTLCENEILAGFQSAATGHFFRFNAYDQMNFTQQMLVLISDSTIAEVTWKTEDAGVVTLTRDEFLAVIREAEAHKRGLMERYWTLKAQVLAAETVDEVNAIQW